MRKKSADEPIKKRPKQNSDALIEKIREVTQPFCRSENFELVHLEYVSCNRDKILRFFLDKPGGITLDDCVYASRQLGDLLDVYIDHLGPYRLEVSSPGPRRPLNSKDDFQRFKGRRVKIETTESIDNQKKFTGILEIIHPDSVVIGFDGKQVEIKDHVIGKATLADQ